MTTRQPDEPVEHGEVSAAARPQPDDADRETESVTSPAKVMRIGSMVKQLLEEVRSAPLDEPSRERLAEIYDARSTSWPRPCRPTCGTSCARSPSRSTTTRCRPRPRSASPRRSSSGWLEGLFHGIQATLFAQQIAARQQLEQMRQLPGRPRCRPAACLVPRPVARPGRRRRHVPLSTERSGRAGAAHRCGSVGDLE